MQLISKEHALALLTQAVEEGSQVKNSDYPSISGWVSTIRRIVAGVFGQESPQVKELEPLLKNIVSEPSYGEYHSRIIKGFLKSLYTEVNAFWTDNGNQPLTNLSPKNHVIPVNEVDNNRVFIVHGHDFGRMQAIARFLEHLGLEPIILHEKPNAGNTIIEKFENNSYVAYAVILLTPDDVGSTVSDRKNLNPRARQNVILELGYFIARLGRNRTAALVVQGVELPSDYSGILYIPLDKGDEWKLILARELKEAGLKVDMNKAI